jgi:hypothetical protein
MRKLIAVAALLAFVAASVSSCKKGCTDSNGANHDPGAKRNDGSCMYDGSVVFWYDSLKSTGTILVTMEDGTQGTVTYDAAGGIPDCGEARYFTYTAAPGFYQYTVALSDNIWGNRTGTGTITISSQQCADKNIQF